MASLPWVPWATNRTEVLSPEQIERIVQMHKESKQNAVIYVLVVLALYLVALAILVGRYLQYERDLDLAMCLGQALERCATTCRRASGGGGGGLGGGLGGHGGGLGGLGPASPGAAATPSAPCGPCGPCGPSAPSGPNGTMAAHALGAAAAAAAAKDVPAPTASGCARKLSLKLMTSWATPAPPLIRQPPRRARPRHPMTDDSSSEASSPPYSPAAAAAAGPAGSGASGASGGCSTSGGEEADEPGGRTAPGGCSAASAASAGVWPAPRYDPAHGRASPAVISVMVCDLQDTQV